MRNTVLKSSLCLLALCCTLNGQAQLFKKELKMPESKLRMVKVGPFVGLEQGKYLNFNFGMERQWQQLKLIKPQTHSVNIQFDMNFKYRIMGAQLGYWFKVGRLNLTYGARASWHTDFDHHRFAVSPNVGYKFMQAHLQMGVHLSVPDNSKMEVNTFYASLRWVFINERRFKK
jgi:hypothetical protein